MRLSRIRYLLVTISALLLALTATVPVEADTELGETGMTGFHALRDADQSGGAVCRYKGIYPSPGGYSYEGKLKWIDVRPPKMKAISGTQEVGWRFKVERRSLAAQISEWVVTYKSPIQRDTTSSSRNASFSMMGINVRVPSDGKDEDPSYQYRVKVNMFWYTGNGGVQGTSTHLVDWYKDIFNNWPERYGGGTYSRIDDVPYCRGWVGFEID